ncbi:hypothetical protein [Curtobacterium sp. MCBD17_003]|uniref:DUF7694 domain-containing protein n=1 Tax=Curtobacterium sp. MCBD17_003 TaxID=2175667 RepID=UPI0011B64640|nr:hypothetical protein [Curtobacterium sp. MCBD17_003]WIE55392.1 hypothetical protein DEI88_004060 [Curtobacterium sp. MCBD17_003]
MTPRSEHTTMPMHLDRDAILRRLSKANIVRPFGPDGLLIDLVRDDVRIIVTLGAAGPDDVAADLVHASISRPDRMPDYDDLVMLHHAVWGDAGYAYQVFVPRAEHVNIHATALHLWGLLDGSPELPRFGLNGSI